jgi:hypothetical protein
MEPSDIDGPKGGESPGEMLADLFAACRGFVSEESSSDVILDGHFDLDAIGNAIKAAVLAGEV